jgi:heptosyltransferase-2
MQSYMSGRKKAMINDRQSIIVHLPNWLGDTVLATPFLHTLRDVFPVSRITLVGSPWVSDILSHFPGIDEILTLENRGKYISTLLLVRLLRERRPDSGFLLTNSFRTALAFYVGNVRERIGYATNFRRLLLTRPIAQTQDIMQSSMVEYYLNLLSPFTDLSRHRRVLRLYPDESERREARRLLLENGWDGEKRLVGLNPFAFQWETKRWLPERFADVTRLLTEKHGVRCVFVSVARDRPFFEKVKQMCRCDMIDLVGKVSLKILPAVMEHYSLFVTNDSGLMHVAAAVNIPIVAIFGSTDWRRTAPCSDRATLIRKPQDHPPCMSPRCRRTFQCMEEVTVDDVLAAAERYL